MPLPDKLNICESSIQAACDAVTSCFSAGGKLLVCGNGGSAADADHIVGELVKGFEKKRLLAVALKEKLAAMGFAGEAIAKKLQGGLPALSLCAHTALITAVINDIGADMVFAQQIAGLGRPGDVLLGISTSGNSENILAAGLTAKAAGLTTIALTGGSGGRMAELFDICINAPSSETARIQEYHSVLYHELCRKIEEFFWK